MELRDKTGMIIALGFALILAIQPVLAQNVEEAVQPITDKIKTIYTAVKIVVLAAAPLLFAAAGVMWKFSGGNPEKIVKARQMFIAGVIGLGIVLLSEVIARVLTILLSP
jgi:HAMP domain-containing protein